MAHDPEGRRARLLSAAVAEFSDHGFAGARIERISEVAGVNRERIYSYFGSKRALFETVLAERLEATLDAVVVRARGPEAAAAFAADYFDACLKATELPRLVAWEGLELAQPIHLEQRRARASLKVDELLGALPGLSRAQVEDLLLTVVTLCHAAVAAPNLALVVTQDQAATLRRRSGIADTAAALVRAWSS